MRFTARAHWNTIRGRLWFGFGAIVALLLVTGLLTQATLSGMTASIAASLDGTQTAESTTGATVGRQLAAIQAGYDRSERLASSGQAAAARAQAADARRAADALLTSMNRLRALDAQRIEDAKSQAAIETERRTAWLLTLIGAALVLALLVVMFTVRRVAEPLDVLVRHARRLSEGDLASRAVGAMPGEFSILARAMNQTGESLSRVVSVAMRTAEEVSGSARDLATVSEQISLSANQMASAMTEVSHGAGM
jgi:methyl-accepting chemotaxis protein